MRNFLIAFVVTQIFLQVGLRSLVAYGDGKVLTLNCGDTVWPICMKHPGPLP